MIRRNGRPARRDSVIAVHVFGVIIVLEGTVRRRRSISARRQADEQNQPFFHRINRFESLLMERFPRSESYKGNRRTRSGQIRSRPFPLSGQIHARCRTVPLRPLLRKQRYAPLSDRAISTVRSGEAFPKALAYPEPPFCRISLMPTRPGSYRPHTGRCIISDSICSAICSGD